MKRIRPAPMGRAFRYQRRLTHIILSVAERTSGASLVTKVEEPVAAAKATKKAAGKAAKKV
jgi:large subunit ribosomal protein L22